MTASIWAPNGFSPEIVPFAFFEGTASEGQTVVSIDPYTSLYDSQLQVFVAGQLQNTSGWSVSGTSVILATPMTLGQSYRVDIYAASPVIDKELPVQTDNAGKFLSTNGTTASWETVPSELPAQLDNAGKVLTTNGVVPSWETIAETAVQTYASIAALRATVLASDTAIVNGYYSSGDGGGGSFYASSDVVSADNGYDIIVSASGVRWKLALSSSINIKQFGAVGNGITNNSTAFSRAESSSYTQIYLPDGEYLTTTASTSLQKTYEGPGVINYSGIGIPVITGGGLQDATFSGTYSAAISGTLKVRIRTTGTPDTIEYSSDSGATWVTQTETYDPGTDSYILGPINILAGPITLYLGISVTFAATTGHTLGTTWTVPMYAAPACLRTTGKKILFGDELFASAFGVQNTSVGINSLDAATTFGVQNTALGYNVLTSLTRGYANIGIGAQVLKNTKEGFFNVGIGCQSLEVTTTGYNNTAVGQFSMQYNLTGYSNVAIGSDACAYQTAGFENTSAGTQALYTNVIGTQNTAVGVFSQRGGNTSLRPPKTTQTCATTSGSAVIVMSGANALVTIGTPVSGPGITFGSTVVNVFGLNVTLSATATDTAAAALISFAYTDAEISPNYCTSIGGKSLYSQLQASYNTAAGFECLYNLTTGNRNTAIGNAAGFRSTTGTYNVYVGDSAGANVANPATVSNVICIGGNSYATGTNGIAIGYGTLAPADTIVIGNSGHNANGLFHYGFIRPQSDASYTVGGPSARYTTVYATTGTINTSDEREKSWLRVLNAAELNAAKKISRECVGLFQWLSAIELKGAENARLHIGVKAQEVRNAFQFFDLDPTRYGVYCYDEWEDAETGELKSRYGIRTDQLIMFLLAAQEQRLQALESI